MTVPSVTLSPSAGIFTENVIGDLPLSVCVKRFAG